MSKKVALLIGGTSSERDVSLMKGKHIEKALLESGYDVKVIDFTGDLNKLATQGRYLELKYKDDQQL